MRRGEQTQNVLQGVEKKTTELNRIFLPPDVKIRPYYDRSDLVRVTTDTVEGNLLRGMVLVLVVLIFFLVSVARRGHHRAHHSARSALRLHLSSRTGEAANLLSIGAIDFGIIIDGTIVMVENIYRELEPAPRPGIQTARRDPAAARDVDRPIFYSVAVIIAGYLPIYALTGPAGMLFHPMANTMAFALIGALILTLTVGPGAGFLLVQERRQGKANRVFEWIRDAIWPAARLVPRIIPVITMFVVTLDLSCASLAAGSLHRRRIPAAPRRRRAMGSRHHALHDFV